MFAVTTLGRLLGFVRDLVIARYFGAGVETDAFLIAWMVPETVSSLLLDGAMGFVLVPLFARELGKGVPMKDLLARTLPPVLAALSAVSAAVAVSASWIVPLIAPGLSASAELSATKMVWIASTTIIFIGLAGYARAALNAHQIFGVPSAVYAGYNLGILGSVLLLRERLGIYSAALGLAFGSALMLLVQVPTLVRRVGMPRLSLRFNRAMLFEFAAFIPVAAFVLGRHTQVYVERFLGSYLEAGAISQLSYAARLVQLPVFAAITVALVTFPALARAAGSDQTVEVEQLTERNIRMASTLILPAALFFILFAPELVRYLFERGAFTAHDTAATASILRVYSLGLLAQALIPVAVRPFYVYRDIIWVPVRSALLGLGVTVVVDVALLDTLGTIGLAAGNTAGVSIMALLLLRDVKNHVVSISIRRLASFYARVTGALLSAGCAIFPLVLLGNKAGLAGPFTLLLGAVSLGLVYLFVGRRLHVRELEDIYYQGRRVLSRRRRHA